MPIENRSDAAEIRAAASILLERLQFLRQAGISFKGQRDLYEILGYDRNITNKQYRDRYARGGLAKRIVEAMPHATWRGGTELVEDENPDVSTAFEAAWKDLESRLQIWSTLRRADILAGLGRYAVILIGAPGVLSDELPKGKPESLLYLTPFSGGGGPGQGGSSGAIDADATIQTFDTDSQSPRFGLPQTYQMRRLDVFSASFQIPVHWSRVIHIAEGILDDEVYGQPTLENVWNLLDDLDKVTGGGAEAFWLRANQGMHLDVDPKIGNFSSADKADLKDQADEYQHNIRRMMRTRGVSIKALGSDVANFSNPADAILTQISGSKGIPKRILTGSEMGQLASSQDRDNWKDQVNGRQTAYAGPYIIRPLVDRLIKYGYLPQPKAYVVQWPHMQTLTEEEKAQGAAKWASVNSTNGSVVFTESEIRDHWYTMEPLTDEDEAESLSESQRAEGAGKWAMVNKTQGSMVFDPDEIRAKWSDLPPLTDEQKAMVISAPERVSATAPTPEQDAHGNPIEPKVPGVKAPTAVKAVGPKGAIKTAQSSFSSTQVQVPQSLRDDIFLFATRIPSSEVCEAAGGKETDLHVTVKYGIHSSSPEEMQQLLSDVGVLSVPLGETSFFSTEEYDVLFIKVLSGDLNALNNRIAQSVEVTDTHPTYTPHVTIAYLKPGLGAKYAHDDTFQGRSFFADVVTFSSSEGERTDIPLRALGALGAVDDTELLQVLEAAILTNNTEVIDAIIGLSRDLKDLGGEGSGNFNHGGRPGEVGGSGEGIWAHKDKAEQDAWEKEHHVWKNSKDAANRVWQLVSTHDSSESTHMKFEKAFEHMNGAFLHAPTAHGVLAALTGFGDIGRFIGLEEND